MQLRRFLSPIDWIVPVLFAAAALGHPLHTGTSAPAGKLIAPAHPTGVTGQGSLRFRVMLRGEDLPESARSALGSAHGGFAVDRRPGRGEVYFALPGTGLLRISSDLRRIEALPSAPEIRDPNLHNTAFWTRSDGAAFLSFPANDQGRIYTTTLDGRVVFVLEGPGAGVSFQDPAVRSYFSSGGRFVPTDAAELAGRLYVTTGYSELDFVLTARLGGTGDAVVMTWEPLVFGGRGEGPGRLGTGHGVTVTPGGSALAVSDRPRSEIDRFSPEGEYLSALRLPDGAWPCDIDYQGEYAAVGCLHGPDRSRGAPIYILRGDSVVSTLEPREDLGLEKFRHVHNAVLREFEGRFYVIAQSWNPGDFVILEQVP